MEMSWAVQRVRRVWSGWIEGRDVFNVWYEEDLSGYTVCATDANESESSNMC